MDVVMITGATGLIGSNVCRLLRGLDRPVRALVRPGSEVEPLAALGVELVEGDITEPTDVARAAEGAAVVVNSAALLGGPEQEPLASEATNYRGSVHCYDVARRGGQRVVELLTTTFFRHDRPLTERSEVLAPEEVSRDPYTVTKHAAHREALRRVEGGDDILFVIPGGTFGPAPCPNRALARTSFNRAIRAAIQGKIADYVSYPVPWVRAEDVAKAVVASIEHGKTGEVYLAFGREDAQSTAAFLSLACEVAGVAHRVDDVEVDPDDPQVLARYGETLADLATRQWPVPWFDNRHTRAQLAYDPLPLREALVETVAWLREIGHIA